ncbi:hypothetical protein Calag_0200 [Caldisphaera lagunensis DSM 15908]|uniref:Uncharacterized protein n=1 Tax=Caldisphaera lagunensis (strain DSM 15908 / JCM 11604 / ANMR 0165 / IC-154) TaxID=1056495 RepID=L0AA26_CALLD|nr:hypothetical protein [Caldisphaera lagunensis]AFZ69982.1 hypothetical protein Calag_0200 [Caldisphaera lagunensis DSM 15908]
MYSKNRKNAYIIIIVALILAVIFFPFMAKINSVVSTNESSMLPKNVESIEVMNIVNKESNSSNQSNVIYLISGVPINIETYYKLKGINIRGESFLKILNTTYNDIENSSSFLLNTSIQISNGIKNLWNETINLTEKLNSLKDSILQISSLIRNSDYIYYNYYQTGENLSKAYSEIISTLILYGNNTKTISSLYEQIYFNALRSEYALYNKTNAYETMNLTKQDILIVLENSPYINNISSPSPLLIEALFKYVLLNGGPKAFNNMMANNFTYQVIYNELNSSNELSAVPLLKTYGNEFYNISSKYPINFIINNLTLQNQYKLYYMLNSISNYSSIETFKEILSFIPIENEEESTIINGIGMQYAITGFNNSKLGSIVQQTTYDILSQRLPREIAIGLSSFISNDSFNAEIASIYAAKTILYYLPSSYQNYSKLISIYIPKNFVGI